MSDKVQESIAQALHQLQEERARIEGAIAKLEGCLQHLVSSTASGVRSRKAVAGSVISSASKTVTHRGRSRAGWTSTARQAAAKRMRNYWQERREAKQAGDAQVRRKRVSKPAEASEISRKRSVNGWTAEKREAARQRMQQYWSSRKDAAQA